MANPISINISFTNTSSFVAAPAATIRTTQYNNNPQYLRYSQLTQDSLIMVYNGYSVLIPQSQLWAAAAAALPIMTYPPIINTQPTNTTVTHPASAFFNVSASAETSINYQWYYSSGSNLNVILTGSNTGSVYGIYTGSTTPYLTCSNTTVNVNNSASYYCAVSNTSGITTSSIAKLYVN